MLGEAVGIHLVRVCDVGVVRRRAVTSRSCSGSSIKASGTSNGVVVRRMRGLGVVTSGSCSSSIKASGASNGIVVRRKRGLGVVFLRLRLTHSSLGQAQGTRHNRSASSRGTRE